jgi:hypothetical protein
VVARQRRAAPQRAARRRRRPAVAGACARRHGHGHTRPCARRAPRSSGDRRATARHARRTGLARPRHRGR